MIRRELVLLLVLGVASAQAFEIVTDSYRAAAARGAIGAVTGRLYEERPRPAAADQPLAGAAVTILPRSGGFLERLEDIKRTARDSASRYRAAVPAILKLQQAYEQELVEAGALDLIRAAVADADGRFSLGDLPAGDWMLIATHTVLGEKRPAGSASKRQRAYTPGTRLAGYQWVTVWVREITVPGRRSAHVELMERNAWFSGVVEDRVPDTGR